MIQPLREVMKEANERFTEGIKTRPDIYKEEWRNNFLLGWLKVSYADLYKKLKRKPGCDTGLKNFLTTNK